MGIEDKSERREVSAAVVGDELKAFARVTWPLANDKARKVKLRGLLGVTQRRIKSLWEGEETAVPRGTETARIEELIGHKIGAAADEEDTDALKRSQQNYRLLEARIAALEALYERVETERSGKHLAALGPEVRGQSEGAARRGAGDGPERQRSGIEHREG